MAGEFIVVYDILPEVAEKLGKTLSEIVRKCAFDLQANAAAEAAVDTGFMKSSIYVVTKDSSNYGEGVLPPPPGAELLPEVEKPDDEAGAIVAVGASYAPYVELGSVHGPAQPFLAPAAELAQMELEAALAEIEKLLTVA